MGNYVVPCNSVIQILNYISMEANIWIGLFLIMISGIANACMDTLQHHYTTSVFALWNPSYWNPRYASKYKYIRGNSQNGRILMFNLWPVPVLIFSGWHLFKSVMLYSWALGISIGVLGFTWWIVAGVFGVRFIFGSSFELFYKYLLRRE